MRLTENQPSSWLNPKALSSRKGIKPESLSTAVFKDSRIGYQEAQTPKTQAHPRPLLPLLTLRTLAWKLQERGKEKSGRAGNGIERPRHSPRLPSPAGPPLPKGRPCPSWERASFLSRPPPSQAGWAGNQNPDSTSSASEGQKQGGNRRPASKDGRKEPTPMGTHSVRLGARTAGNVGRDEPAGHAPMGMRSWIQGHLPGGARGCWSRLLF